jgi:heme o synthase
VEVQLTTQSSGTATAPAASTSPSRAAVRGLAIAAALFKLRIGFAIVLSALGGALLALGQWPAPLDTFILCLGVLLASSGAGACNHYFERDIDACMRRTRTRPFVSGAMSAWLGWPTLFVAMIALGSGLVGWRFNLLAGVMVACGALTYAVIYTLWLKRRTHWNIVIGGAAGSFAVWGGAAAYGGIDLPAVSLLAAVLFLWTPSHFWALAIAIADDYRRAGVPMLPVTRGPEVAARWTFVNTVLLAASNIALAAMLADPLVWAAAVAGSLHLLVTGWRMRRDPQPAVAMRAFRASLIQLGLLLLALFVAFGLS